MCLTLLTISLYNFKELDPVTLHNQALMNMEANPTQVKCFSEFGSVHVSFYERIGAVLLSVHKWFYRNQNMFGEVSGRFGFGKNHDNSIFMFFAILQTIVVYSITIISCNGKPSQSCIQSFLLLVFFPRALKSYSFCYSKIHFLQVSFDITEK